MPHLQRNSIDESIFKQKQTHSKTVIILLSGLINIIH